MRRSHFADLIGVSKQQVSKYVESGAVVIDGSEVDVEESLARLEGRLDETKRQKALGLFSARGDQRRVSASPAEPRALSGKARRDEAQAELAELELAKRKGELVEVVDVEARASEAIQALKETLSTSRREEADKICAKFGMAPEKATALAREMALRDARALNRFARVMTTLVDASDDDEDAIDSVGDASAVRTDELAA